MIEEHEYGIKTDRSSEHLGDCLELMKLIPNESIDMILCDLPYGTTQCKWDEIIPFTKLWESYNRIIKQNGVIVLTASQPFTSALISSNYKHFKNNIVWNKKMPTGHLNAKKKQLLVHEDICVFSKSKFGSFTYNPIMRKGKLRNKTPKRKADNYDDRAYGKVKHKGDNYNDLYYPTTIIEISNANQKEKIHPTQKPVSLFEYLIKTYTNENETVLDNTAGSFTTAIACLETNREYIVMEKEKEYYNKGIKRILEWKKDKNSRLF